MTEETAIIEHNMENVEPFDILIDGNDVDLEFDAMMEEAHNLVFSDDEVVNHETDFAGSEHFNDPAQNPAFVNPIQIPSWPVPPGQNTCSFCLKLREILHFNDTHVQRLEIHGQIGFINHAVLERYPNIGTSSGEREYHMFELSQQSLMGVKQFLVQYYNDRKREGFIMNEDPLLYFYDALCVGFEGGAALVTGTLVPPQNGTAEDGMQMSQDPNLNGPGEEGNRNRGTDSRLAVQRKRMKTLSVKDLIEYFHLTAKEASQKLQLSLTAIKKICRNAGVAKWPSRKIKKYRSDIAKEQSILNSTHDEDRRNLASTRIDELQQLINSIYDQAQNSVQRTS